MSDFTERNHDKVTLMHQRMRYLQVWLIHSQVVIEQDVYVYGTVCVAGSCLALTSQLPLYLLRRPQHLSRGECCLTENNTIQETMVRLEAPRLRLYQGGLPDDLSHPLLDEQYCFPDILSSITKVRAETEK